MTRLHRLHLDEIEKPSQAAALSHTRKFECDDPVWIRNYTGKPKWVAGKVIAKTGPVSYKVRVRGQVQRRHIDQLKKSLQYHLAISIKRQSVVCNIGLLVYIDVMQGWLCACLTCCKDASNPH